MCNFFVKSIKSSVSKCKLSKFIKWNFAKVKYEICNRKRSSDEGWIFIHYFSYNFDIIQTFILKGVRISDAISPMPCLSRWWCFFLFLTPSNSLSLSFFFFLLPSRCLFSFLGEDGSSSALWKDSEVGECSEVTDGSDSTLVSSWILEAPLRRELGSAFSITAVCKPPEPWVASDSAETPCWPSAAASALGSAWCLRLRVGEDIWGRGCASLASWGWRRCRDGELVARVGAGGWVDSPCPRRFLLGAEVSEVCVTAAVALSDKDVVVAVGAAVDNAAPCIETTGDGGSGCGFLPRDDLVSSWFAWRASCPSKSWGPFLPRAAAVVGDILLVGMGSPTVLTGTVSDELCSISPGDFFCFFVVAFLPSELLLLLPAIVAASEGSSGGPETEATPGWYRCTGGLSSVLRGTLVHITLADTEPPGWLFSPLSFT